MRAAAIIREDIVYIFKVIDCQLTLYVVENNSIYKSDSFTLDEGIDQKDLDQYIAIYNIDDECMPKKFVNGEESTYKSILSEGLFIKAEQSAIMKRLSEFSTTIEDIDDAFICAHIVRTELNGLKRNIDYAKSKQQQIRDVSVQGPLLIENIRLRMFLSMHYPMWITTYNMGVSKLTKLNKLVDEYIKDGIANNILHKCEVCSKIQKASICTSCNP